MRPRGTRGCPAACRGRSRRAEARGLRRCRSHGPHDRWAVQQAAIATLRRPASAAAGPWTAVLRSRPLRARSRRERRRARPRHRRRRCAAPPGACLDDVSPRRRVGVK
eukprot:scaffold21858_cov87-Phaeocystis_antarctica.AAC.1